MFSYSSFDSDEFGPWKSAAKRGGSIPKRPRVGSPRIYRVDAWLTAKGKEPMRVTNVWISELPKAYRMALLKELKLPTRKALVFADIDGSISKVADIKITDVWNGWCNVAVRLDNGDEPSTRIHSAYFSEMNYS